MNQLNGTTFYIDTAYSGDPTADYAKKSALVSWVLVSATAADGHLVLGDASASSPKKLDLRVATSGDSRLFHFRGLNAMFPNGIRVVTLANAVATVGLTNQGS